MPTVLRIRNFRFFFYSDEYNEPPHIHVENDNSECKFWLEPISLARNNGIKPHTIREIEKLIYENVEKLKESYYEFHINE